MKRIFLLYILLFTVLSNVLQAEEIKLKSPNHKIVVNVIVGEGQLTYKVLHRGEEVLGSSELGLRTDGIDLGRDAKLNGDISRTTINTKYDIYGSHTTALDYANEITIPLVDNSLEFSLVIRAYNDGVGVRYLLPKNVKRINGENTSWRIASKISRVAWSDFNQSYEGYSHVTSWSEVPLDKPIMPPFTIQTDSHYLSISEADCENYSDMSLRRDDDVLKVCFPFSSNGWTIEDTAELQGNVLKGLYNGHKATPWRTIMIAESLTQLVNSDLITNLCPKHSSTDDFSWVKPGRCLWQWWSVGSPKYEDQHKWYDAAAKLKWEYYLIDDGWRNWHIDNKDQWQLLKDVIDYGNVVGVKTIVWADSKEFRHPETRRKYLDKVKDAGAVGIKIDFIPDATANIMQWYMGTMHDCADRQLLLNFHGSVKPTGLSRTYPNDITREAVRGNEYHMSRYGRVMPLTQDVSLPFTRLMAGHADVTPVMLNPKELASAPYSWAHELAQAIVYLSPITHFCDSYQFYLQSPMFDLFQTLPTTWDETRVLSSTEMGEVVAYAKRKGDCWWIGVMNGASSKHIDLPLDFLKHKATATYIFDGETPTSVKRESVVVTRKNSIAINMKEGGGFVAKIKYL